MFVLKCYMLRFVKAQSNYLSIYPHHVFWTLNGFCACLQNFQFLLRRLCLYLECIKMQKCACRMLQTYGSLFDVSSVSKQKERNMYAVFVYIIYIYIYIFIYIIKNNILFLYMVLDWSLCLLLVRCFYLPKCSVPVSNNYSTSIIPQRTSNSCRLPMSKHQTKTLLYFYRFSSSSSSSS